MARKTKRKAPKKAVHWTKLSRTKLIARCKSFELQLAKLKTQLAEARERHLLNQGANADRLIELMSPAVEFGYRAGEKGVDNLQMTLHKWTLRNPAEARETRLLNEGVQQHTGPFPWEKRDDAGNGNNQTEYTEPRK